MANTFTTNYVWTKPEVGADTDAWGTHVNADLDGIDSTVFTISGVANAALPKAGGTMTGALVAAVGALATPGLTWTGDLNSGAYWIGADHWAIVAGGVSVIDLTTGTVTIPIALTVTGAFTGSSTGSFAGKLTTVASAAGATGLVVPHGSAPTAPNNGDVWSTTTAFFHRVNGVTQQVVYLANTPQLTGGNAFTGNQSIGSGGTLTVAGLTTAQAGLDLTGVMAAPTATEAGYMGMPQSSKSGNYTLALADRGFNIHFTANATLTIPTNASVAFVIGTGIEISADAAVVVTISLATDTLRKVPANTTASQVLTGPGSQFLEKKKTTEWWGRGDAV